MLVLVMTAPILFASYSGLLGGAERVLLDCATRLPRPAVVACPEGPLAEAVRAAGLRHVEIAGGTLRLRAPAPSARDMEAAAGGDDVIGALSTTSALQAAFAAARHAAALARATWSVGGLVHRHRPDALVAWGSRAVLATAAIPRRPPTVAVLHDIHRGTVRTAVRTAAKRADGIVAASDAVADGLDAVILHPGVDLRAFTPSPLPEGPPKALYLGALVGWKRPDLAIEIARRMPELELTLAGEPLEADLVLDPAPNVTLAGHVDAREALARAHVLLHCADEEPWGLALVEALACGRPVVAPAAGGPLEIVKEGAGRLYPPGDADAAVAALREVLADPEAPGAARRRAEAFDVDASAARMAAAIDAAIAG
jgi:glycosyltransferase involved in cell wall biosynthesis